MRLKWYGLYAHNAKDGHFMLRTKVVQGVLTGEQAGKTLLELRLTQRHEPMGPVRARVRDPCLAQNLEVMRQRRLRHRRAQRPARALARAGEVVDDLESYGIAERVEHVGQSQVVESGVVYRSHRSMLFEP